MRLRRQGIRPNKEEEEEFVRRIEYNTIHTHTHTQRKN